MRYSAWASRFPGIPDPLEELTSIVESSRRTSLARRDALAARRAMLDRTEATGVAPRSSPTTSSTAPDQSPPSEASPNERPLRAIHVTRNTHGGNFGRSIVDRVYESYEG